MSEGRSEELKKFFLSQLLTMEELEKVASTFSEKVYSTGTKIFSEGEMGDTMYIVKSGSVRIAKQAEGGEREIITLMPGDFFGEIALFERVPRTASAISLEETSLLEITRSDFGGLISTSPHLCIKILFRIIQAMGQRLQRMNKQTENLFI